MRYAAFVFVCILLQVVTVVALIVSYETEIDTLEREIVTLQCE